MDPTLKQKFFAARIIYFTILLVMIVFSASVFYVIYYGIHEPDADEQLAKLLKYAVYILVPAGAMAGHYVYRRQLAGMDMAQPVEARFGQFQSFILVRAAFLEGPGLLAGVAVLRTGDLSFFLFVAIDAVLFLLWQPTVRSVGEDLQLSAGERNELEG